MRVTSDEREVELDDVISLFVEIQPVRLNVGMLPGLIKVFLHHLQELGASRGKPKGRPATKRAYFANCMSQHHLNINVISNRSIYLSLL